MIEQSLEIPDRSGEVLLAPRGADLLDLAAENHAHLGEAGVRLAGARLGELRSRAREEVLTLARLHSAALGVGGVAEGRFLLATGHQPVFVHPGIWVKYLLLDRLAVQGHTGLAVTVDSDAMEEAAVDVPAHGTAFLERRREVLRATGPEEPYERQPAPTPEEWEDFLRRVDGHLRTVPEERIRRAWEAFLALGRPGGDDYSAFVTILRRRYEGPRRFYDAAVSQIAETDAFRTFFLHILADAERFLVVHNSHLEAYREQQHIRTEAQPFPNLVADEGRIELPFWSVRGGRRERLFLDRRRRRLVTAGRPAAPEGAPLPSGAGDPLFSHLRIRPRAVALTAFLRLIVVDLFIHGVSGGRYDRVTDAVTREFFGVEPPRYAVASATLHLPFAAVADPEADRQALLRAIQEARHNPERLLPAPSPEQRALIEEKWRLIRALEAPALARRDRRGATRAIREINERLSAALGARLAEMEAARAALDERASPADAAEYRGYPFFFYEREAVEGLVNAMLETQR